MCHGRVSLRGRKAAGVEPTREWLTPSTGFEARAHHRVRMLSFWIEAPPERLTPLPPLYPLRGGGGRHPCCGAALARCLSPWAAPVAGAVAKQSWPL